MLEVLLEIIVEGLIQVFGELLVELGWETVKEALGRHNHHPITAAIGFLILGTAIGGVWIWINPNRLVEPGPVRGLNLIASPLLAGTAMHLFGEFRRSRGHSPTNLATFLGGASLAFAIAAVRLLATR
jgi:hypothetical protein